MAKLNNKGFSLVELIIAISVFTFMIIPIISQLSMTMNISDRSRALQEDSEYAEAIMEYFKSTPLDEIGNDNLFNSENPLSGVVPTTTEKTVHINGTEIKYTELAYDTTANPVTIGKGKFYSKIALDTKQYAVAQEGYRLATSTEIANGVGLFPGDDGNEYVSITAIQDPNQTNVGNLTNLDASKVAIIDGDASNSDKSAADAIFTMKCDLLKKSGEDGYKQWEQLMYGSQDINIFDNDTVAKITRISVKNGTIAGKTSYTVTALVDYKDSNSAYPTTLPTYNVYQQTFVQSEPPVIYFMYNPCVYNAEYMSDDFVALDTSGVTNGKEVKMYLIETSAAVPADSEIEAILKEFKDENGNQIYSTALIEYVNESGSRVKRSNIVTHFNIVSGSNLANVKVFTNKELDRVNDSADFQDVVEHGYGNLINAALPSVSFKNPVNLSGTTEPHFVKPLTDDTNFEGRLYTITVTLYNAADDSAVATYTGTKGVN